MNNEPAPEKPMSKGQRAMAAARMPVRNIESAQIWQVDQREVSHAKNVLKYGTPEEIAAVDNGVCGAGSMANYIRARVRPWMPKTHSLKQWLATGQPPMEPTRSEPPTVEAVITRHSDELDAELVSAEIIPLRPKPRKDNIGPRLPPGVQIWELARKAAAMRNSGNYPSLELVSKALGINPQLCRQISDVAYIADRTDLPEHEAALAADAMRRMSQGTHRIPEIHAMIEPIAKRLWGDSRTSKSRSEIEAKRLDRFDRGYGILITACKNAPKIEIPHLTEEKVREILAELHAAIRDVKSFAAKIGDIHR